MSRNSTGVYSLPNSVNPVVAGTPVASIWANLTMSDIKTELTDSLCRSGKGAMLAQLQLASGAVGAPGLGFSAEVNSGLYRAGAGDLRVAVGGVDRLTLTASQLTIAAALSATGQIKASDGTQAAPGLSFSSEAGAGLYRAGTNDLRMAVNSKDISKYTTKLSVSAATAATGGTRQDALSLTNGDLDLSAVTVPTSTTAIANRLTPMNLIKAWALITCSNAGTFVPTVTAGFNIASVARADANSVTVTWAQAFASTAYAVGALDMGFAGPTVIVWYNTSRLVGSTTVKAYVANTGTPAAIDGNGTTLFVFALGAQ